MKFEKEKEDSIVKDYLDGLNTVEIAKKWNTYNTSIRRVLLRRGVKIRSNKEVRTTHQNPFKDNDEYSEYFLGLLLTDGYIFRSKTHNSQSVTLSLKDEELVEKFRDFVCPKNKVSKVLQKKYGTYMYSASIRNSEIVSWLDSKGNFVNKSYDCDIYIPITPHILRGIFDGDGYWHKANNGSTLNWGVCGKSKKFLIKIQEYLQSNDISSTLRISKRDLGDMYYLEIYKQIDVAKAANLMYKDASIYLERKYSIGYLFGETLREKLSKFRERESNSNPEPSFNKSNKLIDKTNGRFILEGAETIMAHLSYLNNNMVKGQSTVSAVLESRLGADIYDEKAMLKEYIEGSGDIHSLAAKGCFPDELAGVEVKDVKKVRPDLRKKAKAPEFDCRLLAQKYVSKIPNNGEG